MMKPPQGTLIQVLESTSPLLKQCNADWWPRIGDKRKRKKRKQQRRQPPESCIFNKSDVERFSEMQRLHEQSTVISYRRINVHQHF